jgi:hypothetical protein
MNKAILLAALLGLALAVPLSDRGADQRQKVRVVSDDDAELDKVTYAEDPEHASFLQIRDAPLPFTPVQENVVCNKDASGADYHNTISHSVVGSVGACQTLCQDEYTCKAFTFMTGAYEKGSCTLCNVLPMSNNINVLDGIQAQSVTYVAGCNCIHRYPDVPCECQKPHMTISYPDQNAGMASVYDPMNPSANNNVNALIKKKDSVTKTAFLQVDGDEAVHQDFVQFGEAKGDFSVTPRFIEDKTETKKF